MSELIFEKNFIKDLNRGCFNNGLFRMVIKSKQKIDASVYVQYLDSSIAEIRIAAVEIIAKHGEDYKPLIEHLKTEEELCICHKIMNALFSNDKYIDDILQYFTEDSKLIGLLLEKFKDKPEYLTMFMFSENKDLVNFVKRLSDGNKGYTTSA